MALFGKDSGLKWKYAATPFLDESQDQKASEAGAPAPGSPSKAHTCPWCCHMFEPNRNTLGDRAKEFRKQIAAAHELPDNKQRDNAGVEEDIDLSDKEFIEMRLRSS